MTATMVDNVGFLSQRRGAFHRLPPEVLAMIVSFFTATGRYRYVPNDFDTLKALRLTHRNFAGLAQINDMLFHSIQMQTSVSSPEAVQRGDLSRISGSVRKIVFVTPPSWAMMFETFAEIVNCGLIRAHAQRLAEQGLPCDYNGFYGTQEEFVDKYWGGNWPFSDNQLRKSFDTYMQMAKTTQALLQESNHEIDEAWVKLLRSLGDRPRKVLFHTRSCHGTRTIDLSKPNNFGLPLPIYIGSHHHTDWSKRYACESASALAGDALFAKAISCISVSGLRVSHLSIKLRLKAFDWDRKPKWEAWNLGELKKLKFMPRTPACDTYIIQENVLKHFPVPKADNFVMNRASAGLGLLVDKSCTSLERLIIDPFESMCWPDREAPNDMPELEYLCCKPGRIEPTLLARWMARMPRLRRIEMNGHLAEDLEFMRWMDVFDAVHNHPNVVEPDAPGMLIGLDQIVTNDWSELSYEGIVRRRERDRTTEATTADEEFDPEDIDIDVALRSYLVYGESGRIRHALRSSLQDGSDDNESNEAMRGDEDESDENSDEDENE